MAINYNQFITPMPAIPTTYVHMSLFLRLLPAFFFWLLTSLYHLKFSLFLVNPLETYWGVITLKEYASFAGYCLLILLFLYFIWYWFKGLNAKMGMLYWWVWLVLIALINQFLLATPIENIHFVQYGLLSTLLLWCFDGSPYSTQYNSTYLIPKVLFWTTMAGIIDEIMQYFWITVSYSNYMDFNDFLLNMMGAIAGLLFYSGLKQLRCAPLSIGQTLKSLEAWIMYGLGLLLLLLYNMDKISFSWSAVPPPPLFTSDPAQSAQHQIILLLERKAGLFGSWQPAFNKGEYYVLSPLEGSVLLLLVGIVAVVFIKKMNTPPAQA